MAVSSTQVKITVLEDSWPSTEEETKTAEADKSKECIIPLPVCKTSSKLISTVTATTAQVGLMHWSCWWLVSHESELPKLG